MQAAPRAQGVHVAVFGRPNAGKSALINSLVGHSVAPESPVPGTTAEATYIPVDTPLLGRSLFIDTVGIPEDGRLGERWHDMLDRVLSQTDVAILAVDATCNDLTEAEHRLLATLAPREIPVVTVLTRIDLVKQEEVARRVEAARHPAIGVSATTGTGVEELRVLLRDIKPDGWAETLVGDLVEEGDIIVAVIQDGVQAPRRQMNALHAQLLREAIDAGCLPMVVREAELPVAMTALTRPPALVVADSANFDRMLRIVPPDIPLTSLSILAARQKGNLTELVAGVRTLARLRPGDRVLVAEGCSHRPFFEEAPNERIPVLLRTLVGGPLRIDRVRGDAFPDSLRGYQLIVHCGACVLNRREMLRRQAIAKRHGVPITNYALLSTYVNHALPRALLPLRHNGALGSEIDELLDTAQSGAFARSTPKAQALHTQ